MVLERYRYRRCFPHKPSEHVLQTNQAILGQEKGESKMPMVAKEVGSSGRWMGNRCESFRLPVQAVVGLVMRGGAINAHPVSQDFCWSPRETPLPPRPLVLVSCECDLANENGVADVKKEELVPEYCEYFRDKSMEELDELARSFHFGELRIRAL